MVVKRGYVALDAGLVHYRYAGEGPTVLLLHPNGTSSELFAEVIPRLATTYRVVAPDRFGHGESDGLPDDFPRYEEYDEPSNLAGRIEPYLVAVDRAFLRALDITRTSIVGQHTGSHLALELAIAEPSLVERLVLVSVTDWQTRGEADACATPDAWASRRGISPFLDVDRLEAARQSRIEYAKAGELHLDGSHLQELWQMRQRTQAAPQTTAAVMNAITLMAAKCIGCWPDTSPQATLYYRANRRLPLAPVPTALIAGAYDEPGMFMEEQATLIPGELMVGSAVVPDVGAFFALERPDVFVEHVMKFLQAPGPSGRGAAK